MFDYSKLLGKMREKGVTQEEVASKIGISSNALRNKLKGRSSFNVGEIWAISLYLGITGEVQDYFFCLK